jgi:hypothetical protein
MVLVAMVLRLYFQPLPLRVAAVAVVVVLPVFTPDALVVLEVALGVT